MARGQAPNVNVRQWRRSGPLKRLQGSLSMVEQHFAKCLWWSLNAARYMTAEEASVTEEILRS